MSKTLRFARALNWIVLLVFLAAIIEFISQLTLYSVFLALVTALIAWGIFNNKSWGYFCAGCWGLACFQLAKQGLAFPDIKHEAMVVGLLVMISALFLHELLVKPVKKVAQDDSKRDPSERNMPE